MFNQWIRRIFFSTVFLFVLSNVVLAQDNIPLYRKSAIALDMRVKDLLQRLTLEEKISLLGFRSKEVARLQIPAYNWWNEALHGVARAGQATVFPQAIAMAATFDDSLLQEAATVISTEARAKYNLSVTANRRQQYMGLTFWSPNINIFRDPRWGRGQETYGEDPFLTACMGAAFVKGMQGNDPVYLKTAACAKHFAVHSGPESGRHRFNAVIDEKDLRETYLYAFKKLVDAGVESVMCAYNQINGEPCCINNLLLKKILRSEWKFKGHIVTDCWALEDIWKAQHVKNNSIEVAAAALKAGVNLDCSNMLQDDLLKAYQQKLVTITDIDSALGALLRTQFRLGFYDDAAKVPFNKLGADSIHTQTAVNLARKIAAESMVLLKNDKAILPLDKNEIKSIAIVGPNAGSIEPLIGNYHGLSETMVSFAEGITAAAGPAVAVQYDQGSDDSDTTHFGGVWMAGESDVIIAVVGLTPVLEGEEGDAFLAANGGDRLSLSIPLAHIELLKRLKQTGKPLVAVVTAGSDVDIAAIEPYADAILIAWYPGEQGGNALADIVFGKIAPSGKLPVTFYQSLNDLPAYENYAVANRTYRYFKGKVQYPFGFGLSYTSFSYQWEQRPERNYSINDTVRFSVQIHNTGDMDGDEVLQAYIQYPDLERMPLKELKAFKRTHIVKAGNKIVSCYIPVRDLVKWELNTNSWKLYPGKYHLLVGGSSADVKLEAGMKIQ